MNHNINYDHKCLKEIILTCLFFDDRIDLSNFSLSTILGFGSDIVLNHELICVIIERGYIDMIFSNADKTSCFSGEILSFLLTNFKSYELIHALQLYLYDLIRKKEQKKILAITKQRQNIIKELYEVFRDENISPYIIIEITNLFTSLIYIETDHLKAITALINKNIVDVLVNKIKSNNLNLILSLTTLLKALTNKIEEGNIKSSFTKNIDNLISNTTAIIKNNKYYRSGKLIDNILTIHINFVAKNSDNQKFYLQELKKKINNKEDSLLYTLVHLFFDNLISEEYFAKTKEKMRDLKERLQIDIRILMLFKSLIKLNKAMKYTFKEKTELDFFCSGMNVKNLFNNNNSKKDFISDNRKDNTNALININNINNNTAALYSSTDQFNSKVKLITKVLKDKILIQSNDANAFQTLVKKFGFEFLLSFYDFLGNMIEFCFHLLNEDENDIKKIDSNSPYIFNLRELSQTINELITQVPYNNYYEIISDYNKKIIFDRLVQANQALNKCIDGTGDN